MQMEVAGYTCECPLGYAFDDDSLTCVNVDECAVDTNICNNGQCVDSEGSFYCICLDNFAGKYCEVGMNCIIGWDSFCLLFLLGQTLFRYI